MALRCKPGDLALVINGPNVGKAVTCLELLAAGTDFVDESVGRLWRVDRRLQYSNDALPGVVAMKYLAPDSRLLPIGDPGPSVLAQEPVAPVTAEDEYEDA